MFSLTKEQRNRALVILVTFHVTVIAASNYLVQIPFEVFGLHSTWGTFSFPFVYLATDLTVRVFGQKPARKIIFYAMIPALVVSYFVSILFYNGEFQGFGIVSDFNLFVFRIAAASFIAYLSGQLVDVKVFSFLRYNQKWWVAPSVSTIFGNLLDTFIFYSVAFWSSSDSFMAQHWPEIGIIDYCFKIVVSMLLFLPAYGILLSILTAALTAAGDPRTAGRQ